MKRFKYRIMISRVLTALLCVLLFACKKSAGDDAKKAQGTLVKPNYNRSSTFRNPLNGWVMYGSGSGLESYWDTEYYVPDLGKKVKAIDYASACYIRTNWATFNPANGVYAW